MTRHWIDYVGVGTAVEAAIASDHETLGREEHLDRAPLLALINRFLDLRREASPGGGWAAVTDEDMAALSYILIEMRRLKCEPDADYDRPIEWHLTNRRTHQRLVRRNIPYTIDADHEGLLSALEPASLNAGCANEDLWRLLRSVRERRR